jgi:hypothetical protein
MATVLLGIPVVYACAHVVKCFVCGWMIWRPLRAWCGSLEEHTYTYVQVLRKRSWGSPTKKEIHTHTHTYIHICTCAEEEILRLAN